MAWFSDAGIAVGSYWGYYELGWALVVLGPVENASLMRAPGTALLHSAW